MRAGPGGSRGEARAWAGARVSALARARARGGM